MQIVFQLQAFILNQALEVFRSFPAQTLLVTTQDVSSSKTIKFFCLPDILSR